MLQINNFRSFWVFSKLVICKNLLKKNILVNKEKKSIENFSKDDWTKLAVFYLYKYVEKYTIESESLVATRCKSERLIYAVVDC